MVAQRVHGGVKNSFTLRYLYRFGPLQGVLCADCIPHFHSIVRQTTNTPNKCNMLWNFGFFYQKLIGGLTGGGGGW